MNFHPWEQRQSSATHAKDFCEKKVSKLPNLEERKSLKSPYLDNLVVAGHQNIA
jgi:hypothetical protein